MEGAQGLKSKELFPGVFSRHALAYQRRLEEIMSRGEATGRVRAVELLEAGPGMRILDLACGPGTLSKRLSAMVSPGGEVVGVDLAPGMVEVARALNIPNARFEVMDIDGLAFDDESFDGALCGHGFQFMPDLRRSLSEARRVLRRDGRLCASVPVTARASDEVWKTLDSVVDRWLPRAPEVVDRGTTRETIDDAEAFKQAALSAGFTAARVEAIEENVHWESADHLVTNFMGWWDCASRLEGMDQVRRQAIMDDAIGTLTAHYPGAIETKGRNHVLVATA
jgi:ubiquinone/menaquinone biosynthesis C-methylase UbiE